MYMGISLNPYERETTIRFNEEEGTAVVSTFNRSWITSLKRKGVVPTELHGGQKQFVVPKEWVKIRPNKRVSEETRAARAEAMRTRRAKV